MLYVTSTTRQEHYNCAARWQLSVGCEFTRGKPSVVRKANDNLALLQQVRQAGPSAGERTTEPQIWHSCQETTTLVQTHRQLAESGGKSPEDKQQGLRTLSSEVRQELACMRRAERICRHRKRKECSIPQWFGGKSIGRSKKKTLMWCGLILPAHVDQFITNSSSVWRRSSTFQAQSMPWYPTVSGLSRWA